MHCVKTESGVQCAHPDPACAHTTPRLCAQRALGVVSWRTGRRVASHALPCHGLVVARKRAHGAVSSPLQVMIQKLYRNPSPCYASCRARCRVSQRCRACRSAAARVAALPRVSQRCRACRSAAACVAALPRVSQRCRACRSAAARIAALPRVSQRCLSVSQGTASPCRSLYCCPYCDTKAALSHDTNHCIATYPASQAAHAVARPFARPAVLWPMLAVSWRAIGRIVVVLLRAQPCLPGPVS